jgi:phage shock protein A
VARLAKENASLGEEVRKLKDVERRLRVKVRETESELETLRRRWVSMSGQNQYLRVLGT